MVYSNADILAAVLTRFAQPAIQQAAGAKLFSSPATQMMENKVRSWLGLSQNWSFASELSQFVEPSVARLATPFIKSKLAGVPDDMIPEMAHGIVDVGLKQGGVSLFEGRLQLDHNDLAELKKLLDYNLPLKPREEYQVITEEPNHGTGDTETGEQGV